MSYSNYEKAVSKILTFKYMSAGEQTEELMKKVEEILDVKLSKQHYNYFKNYGYLAFSGIMLYGIYNDVFNGIYGDNAVVAPLQDRKEYGLPKEWLPIYDFDDGYIAYLDYSHLNQDREPRIIMAIYTGNSYEVTEIIAEDLGDFLLELVQQQLDSQ